MPGRKRTPEEIAERAILAQEFRSFRKEFKFKQKNLVDALGICRRTIQMIEGGLVNPKPETLKRFRDLVEETRKKQK